MELDRERLLGICEEEDASEYAQLARFIMGQVSIEERRRLCEAKVTLDGQPAVIAGVRCKFATVAQVPEGLSYEWSWDTVARIVARGGQFKS